MKTTRKLASLLLALVMVFALATTAFAAETGTTTTGRITVANPIEGRTYTAYKIFDVVYDTVRAGHYSYTINSSTNEWYGTVSTYANDTAHGLKLTQVNGTDTYVVTTGNGFSASDFAVALKAKVDGKNGTDLTESGSGGSVFADLSLGYYFVAGTNGALCNLTTTNPSATIYDKNDMPFLKEGDATTVEVGQTVNYTITCKMPDYTDFNFETNPNIDTLTYKVADTMSEGLTFQKDVKVVVGSREVSNNLYRIAYDVEGNPNSFTVDIPYTSIIRMMTDGGEIPFTITYSAVVNEKAIAQISTNEATLTYTNDPYAGTVKTTKPQEHKVYSAEIVIDKFENGNENKKLPDAKFVLYKRGEGNATKPTSGDYDTVTANGTTTYYPRNYYEYIKATATEGAKVKWVPDKVSATVVKTDNGGAATFGGLADGTYYLEETEAPAGYNPLTAPAEFTVAGSTTDTTKLSVTAKVPNNTGTLLPSTGGMGTTVFYVLGFALVMGAVVLLVTKKRMSDVNG